MTEKTSYRELTVSRRSLLKGMGGLALVPIASMRSPAFAQTKKASFAYGSIGYIWSVVHISQKIGAYRELTVSRRSLLKGMGGLALVPIASTPAFAQTKKASFAK